MKYVLLLGALLLICHQYMGCDLNDWTPAQPIEVKSLSAAERSSLPIPQKIPAKLYNENPASWTDPWGKPLYANKKTIVVFTGAGHRLPVLFVKNVLKHPEYKSVYALKQHSLGFTGTISYSYDSPKEFMWKNCGETHGCIINPQKREFLIFPNGDERYWFALLEKYKDW